MKKTAFGLILLLLTALFVSAEEKSGLKEDKDESKDKEILIDTNQIIWYRYDEGIKLAAKTNKPIMINFTATWCGYCKKMNRTTFADKHVIDVLNNGFVGIKVDGDSQRELDVNGYKITERNLTRAEYGVGSYPTYWFLKANTERIGKQAGYMETEPFLDILYYVKDALYDKMKYNEYLKNGGHKGSH
jgi:thioredoxin-related protein